VIRTQTIGTPPVGEPALKNFLTVRSTNDWNLYKNFQARSAVAPDAELRRCMGNSASFNTYNAGLVAADGATKE